MNRIADGHGERRFLNRNDRQFFCQDRLRLLVDLCPGSLIRRDRAFVQQSVQFRVLAMS